MSTTTDTTADTTTKLGTPVSKKWETAWVAVVDETEARLGHRCCGAHAPDHMPCELQSTHANGRCRFHGGTAGIGAPKNNTNARIHGLYSRRLQTCGDHCPQWKACPFAGADVLKLRASQRPICAYEQREHDLISQLEKDTTPNPLQRYDTTPPYEPHKFLPEITCLRENLKLLQIMITRAGAALKTGLTQDTEVTAEKYQMTTSKPSAALQALQILTREHRATLTLYERLVKTYGHPRENIVVPFPKEYLET